MLQSWHVKRAIVIWLGTKQPYSFHTVSMTDKLYTHAKPPEYSGACLHPTKNRTSGPKRFFQVSLALALAQSAEHSTVNLNVIPIIAACKRSQLPIESDHHVTNDLHKPCFGAAEFLSLTLEQPRIKWKSHQNVSVDNMIELLLKSFLVYHSPMFTA